MCTVPAAQGGSGAPPAPAWPGMAGPTPAPCPRGRGPTWGCPCPCPGWPGSPSLLGAAVPPHPSPNILVQPEQPNIYQQNLTPILLGSGARCDPGRAAPHQLLTQGQGWLSVWHCRFTHTLRARCWGSAGKLSPAHSSAFWQVHGEGSIAHPRGWCGAVCGH